MFKVDYRRISNRSVIYLLFALFWLPIFVFGSLNIRLIRTLVETDKVGYLERAAAAQSQSVEKFLKDNYEQMSSVATRDPLYKILSGAQPTNKKLEVKDYNLHDSIFVTRVNLLNSKGLVVASSSSSQFDKSFLREAYFRMAFSDKRSQMFAKTDDKISPEIVFSAPVYGKKRGVIGVLAIHYAMSVLQDIISPQRDLAGKKSFGLVVNASDEVIASTNSFDLEYRSLELFDPMLNALYEKAIKSTKSVYSQDDVFLLYRPIAASKWRSIYVQPANAFVGSVYKTMSNFIAVMVLVFILAMASSAVTYLLMRRIRIREEQLKEINQEILADLQLGLQVQKALQYTPRLPDSLDYVSFQMAAKYVSGDLSFTYLNSALNIMTFMIIDVNGKGVQAALKAAAFSSIAKSVWTSRESYGAGKDRFSIFRSAAQKFVANSEFKEDFLAVVACEYHIDQDEIWLYRLNYTAPFIVTLSDSHEPGTVSCLDIPNDTVVKASFHQNQALALLGDAFIESSRSEKKIIKSLTKGLVSNSSNVGSQELCNMILEIPLQNQFVDDQTILILKAVA